MMHVLPCAQVRDDLPAYHDGELEIENQVLIQGHLQECVACRLEATALTDLGDALRTMAGSVPGRASAETGLITRGVLDRIRVEQRFSLVSQLRESFQDMHLVWAGLGATFAMLFCICASAGVLHAANQERPDSLAGIISTIASGATDPVRLVDSAYENKPLLDTTESLPVGQETDLMLSAFVTRDGRIQNVELLEEQARALHVKPEVVLAMIDAASRARFSPTQAGAYPGGVNVVWLVTSTTVKGRPDYDLYLLTPPRLSKPVLGPPTAPKPAPAATPSAKSTAGDDAPAAFAA
jgi:Putative zinc-finger